MKKYKIKIDPDAKEDVQQITDWYNQTQAGQGERFQKAVVSQINMLSKSPQIYAIRNKNIRCLNIKKFPYMAHFYINEDDGMVEVLAVISTDREPKIWNDKTKFR